MADDYADDAHNDPAEAFERLRGEVSLLRHAVGSLTTARDAIEVPDYEPTLARTEKVLGALVQQIDAIRKSPTFALTPDKMAAEIVSSALYARREDQKLVTETRTALEQATRDMRQITTSARTGARQNRWLYLFGIGGLIVGILLWAVFAGIVARAMPTSWHWPERMATRTLNEASLWDAGRHLMMADNPDTWNSVAAAVTLVGDNREAIAACRKSAAKAKKAVRCAIDVKAGE